MPLRADEEVHARQSTRDERTSLGLDTAIVMVVHRHTFLAGNKPLEFAEMIAPAHRYRYRAARSDL